MLRMECWRGFMMIIMFRIALIHSVESRVLVFAVGLRDDYSLVEFSVV